MNPSILIVDDSARSREMFRFVLQKSGLAADFLEAGNGRDALALLDEHPVDVIICDLKMPGMDGFQFLSEMEERQKLDEIPVIILTGAKEREQKIAGLERGASDYITKPFDPGELAARVKVQLKIKSLQDRLRESNRMLEHLSMTDPLTNLANRRFFMDALEKAVRRSQKDSDPLALAVVDLDHFKLVNDTYGHQAGDQVLVTVANLLRRNLRPFDIVARYGGEEFALLLQQADLQTARAIAERLRIRIGGLSFSEDLTGLIISASFGLAALPLPEIETIHEFMRLADEALYLAKANGRNRVEFTAPVQSPG